MKINLQAGDGRIVALFDSVMGTLQRRGWLPLHTAIMAVQCVFWSSSMANWANTPLWILLFAPLFLLAAYCLAIEFRRWRDAHGYWDDYRKTQRLNAYALANRDKWPMRMTMVMACFSVAAILMEIAVWVNVIAFIAVAYLPCCRYVGPGDFARERRDSLSGAPETR